MWQVYPSRGRRRSRKCFQLEPPSRLSLRCLRLSICIPIIRLRLQWAHRFPQSLGKFLKSDKTGASYSIQYDNETTRWTYCEADVCVYFKVTLRQHEHGLGMEVELDVDPWSLKKTKSIFFEDWFRGGICWVQRVRTTQYFLQCWP